MTDPRRTLILGGARSGKSAAAERALADVPHVLYVATGGERADDPEWVARVAAHRSRRPVGWRTVETIGVAEAVRNAAPSAAVLIDCLTLWLTAMMDDCGAWSDELWQSGAAGKELDKRVDALADAWVHTPARVVAVTNEVGWGVVPETAAGRRFQDEMGRLNQRIAALSDEVLLIVAGRTLRL